MWLYSSISMVCNLKLHCRTYNSYRFAQNVDNVLICDHSRSGQKEVGYCEVKERDSSYDRKWRDEGHLEKTLQRDLRCESVKVKNSRSSIEVHNFIELGPRSQI